MVKAGAQRDLGGATNPSVIIVKTPLLWKWSFEDVSNFDCCTLWPSLVDHELHAMQLLGTTGQSVRKSGQGSQTRTGVTFEFGEHFERVDLRRL